MEKLGLSICFKNEAFPLISRSTSPVHSLRTANRNILLRSRHLLPSPPLDNFSPSRLLPHSFSSAPSLGSEKKRAADYGGSVISSPMFVVPTSPLKNRFWFLSFTLAGVTAMH
ncbi:uncharacterized protein LOC108868420 isoform X2 [Pyrus x bretschneideri]|uniref:uncharacterized protein LOC108868420 isoform X2 n=1 Tax=Pyrus x bretschneideri TaxID=225117 RepID=UPI00202F002B|nr:uncharacterized protein LOC108868420 isoform X2 [Pyrus x bretschneideri]